MPPQPKNSKVLKEENNTTTICCNNMLQLYLNDLEGSSRFFDTTASEPFAVLELEVVTST